VRDLEGLLDQMSLKEQVKLLAGRDWWHTEAFSHLGIPSLQLSDGPFAVRGPSWVGATSVSFPCGTAIGATFDPGAARLLAGALADECHDKSIDVLLGPTVNLQRHPLGGRHFECYSEDPVLTTELAVSYIEALQERGVAATIKHFVANDTEFERHTISSDMPGQVLGALYLFPFKEAIEKARPLALMTSYNRVNGTYAAEHAELLGTLLRQTWGFEGLVMSDWFGAQSTAASALAGLDLEMPGPPIHYGNRLVEAVETGEVKAEVVRERALKVLELIDHLGRFEPESRPRPLTSREERREISRHLARSSFVLLRNESLGAGGPLLPLSLSSGDRLAVVGPNALSPAAQGGGSARVQPVRVASLLEALKEHYEPLGVEVVSALGCRNFAKTPALDAAFELEYFDPARPGEVLKKESTPRQPLSWAGPPELLVPGLSDPLGVRAVATFVPELGGEHVLSLSQVGKARLFLDGELLIDGAETLGERFDGLGSVEVSASANLEQGRAYEIALEYTSVAGLPVASVFVGLVPPLPTDEELIVEAARTASQADAVVCVVGTSPEWETEGHDRPEFKLPGRQDDLIEAVQNANEKTVVLLNTGSPVATDWAEAVPAIMQLWFGGEEIGRAAAEVLSGSFEPGGRLPHTMPVAIEDAPAYPYYPGEGGHMSYGEGLFLGYRHYASTGRLPRFWFGHGLTYTSFALAEPGLETSDDSLTVTTRAKNTGARRGSVVLQAYLSPLRRREGEPSLVFAGSARAELEPGESQSLTITTSLPRLQELGLDGECTVLVGESADPSRLVEAGQVKLSA
jgi:beta-glucosidase